MSLLTATLHRLLLPDPLNLAGEVRVYEYALNLFSYAYLYTPINTYLSAVGPAKADRRHLFRLLCSPRRLHPRDVS